MSRVSIVLWTVFIVGAVPRSGERSLGQLFGWWPSLTLSILSSLAEFFLGFSLARRFLIAIEMDLVSDLRAAFFVAAGIYLIGEAVVRIGVATKSEEGLPSLPVYLVSSLVTLLFPHRQER